MLADRKLKTEPTCPGCHGGINRATSGLRVAMLKLPVLKHLHLKTTASCGPCLEILVYAGRARRIVIYRHCLGCRGSTRLKVPSSVNMEPSDVADLAVRYRLIAARWTQDAAPGERACQSPPQCGSPLGRSVVDVS